MKQKSFAETFEEIRNQKRISQSTVAHGARMKDSAIRRLVREDSSPYLSTVIRIATGLGLIALEPDAIQLLRSAGIAHSSLSPLYQAKVENWPQNEGVRAGINTIRIQNSILQLIVSDLKDEAPNEKIREDSQEISELLDSLSRAGDRLNIHFQLYERDTRPRSGYKRPRKSKEV